MLIVLLTVGSASGLLGPTSLQSAEPSAASQAIRARAAQGRSSLQRALSKDPAGDSSFTRLAHPEVAERMQLTDERPR